jgi:hypothetical protein
VQAALTLLDIPYRLIEGETWSSQQARGLTPAVKRVDWERRPQALWHCRFPEQP